MNKNKFDILTFSKLSEGIDFYLNESFHYINEVLINEYASLLFSKLIETKDFLDKDIEIISKLDIPEKPVELLQSSDLDPITDETAMDLSELWNKAQLYSRSNNYNFGKDHKIVSIEILGHLNSFAFFIETLTNRHLLFLYQTKSIDEFSYNRISKARILERLIYIFKDELKYNKIQFNEISNLFRMRNLTVHFTPENVRKLNPTISQLIKIWKQSKIIVEKFEQREKFNEELYSIKIDNYTTDFKSKWT